MATITILIDDNHAVALIELLKKTHGVTNIVVEQDNMQHELNPGYVPPGQTH